VSDVGARERAYSWKKALLHALIPLSIIIVGGAIAIAAGAVKAPRRFGEGLGQFSVFAMLLAVGVSYLAQTGRRRAAWGVGAGAVGLVGVIVVVLVAAGPPAARAVLTAAERRPLEIREQGGERRLVHPTLGFSLLHPGPGFVESEQAAAVFQQSTRDPGAHAYAYARASDRSFVIVTIGKGLDSRAGMEGMVRGLTRPLLQAVKARVKENEITWSESRKEAVLSAELGPGVHFRFRALVGRLGAERVPTLVAIAASDEPARLQRLMSSLELP
jgi:hypothetical protein